MKFKKKKNILCKIPKLYMRKTFAIGLNKTKKEINFPRIFPT